MDKFSVFYSRWQWVLLVFAAPFLLFPTVQRSWVLLVIPLILLVSWVLSRKPLPLTSINVPLLLLGVMLLVSLYATYDMKVSFANISGLLLGVGFYYAFVNAIRANKGVWLIGWVYLVAGLGITAISLLGMQQVQKIGFLAPLVALLPASLTSLPGEESGFHPNIVAGSMLWLLPLLFVLMGWIIIRWKSLRKKVKALPFAAFGLFLALSLVLVSFVFVVTQSRTGYIALFLSLVSLLLLLIPSRWRVPAFILVGIMGIALTWYAWQAGWLEMLYKATTPGGTATNFQTLNSRVGYWSQAITIINAFPFTGIGLNTMETISAYIYPYFSSNPGGGVTHAHNEFLQVALDLGIPGLIAFIAIYFVIFWNLISVWNRAGRRSFSQQAKGLDKLLLSSTGLNALSLGIGLSLLAHMLFGFTDAIALGTKPNILFWMLLGLASGLHQLVCGNVLIGEQPVNT